MPSFIRVRRITAIMGQSARLHLVSYLRRLSMAEARPQRAQAEYVPVREEISQFEEIVDITDSEKVRDSIDAYFDARRASEADERSKRGGHLLADDAADKKNVFYMFRERGTKVKISFVEIVGDEALKILNDVRKLSGLEPVDQLTPQV